MALGRPTIVGPAVGDFQETMDELLAGDGIIQTDRQGLPGVISDLLSDQARCAQLAQKGRAVIRMHQGATARHADMLAELLAARPAKE